VPPLGYPSCLAPPPHSSHHSFINDNLEHPSPASPWKGLERQHGTLFKYLSANDIDMQVRRIFEGENNLQIYSSVDNLKMQTIFRKAMEYVQKKITLW
jgi:hypothetical protein